MIIEALRKRYPHQQNIDQAVIDSCLGYIKNGMGDNDAEQKLSSENDYEYWQQFSEVLLAHQLIKAGLNPIHQADAPDFLIERDGKRIWIEVITPEPSGFPDEWTNFVSGRVISIPHEAILLRWTAAIKEKADKLLGYTNRKTGKHITGYIEKGIVGKADAYVVAINSRLLRGFGGAFPELYGISQFPFAVEATFCVGPMQIHIDRQTLKTTGSNHQHRPLIPKPNGSSVPADTFFDPQFAPVSAIWAVDVDELLLINEARPMVVVHNPNATNSFGTGVLPAQSEYIAMDHDSHYQLDRHDGILIKNEQSQ